MQTFEDSQGKPLQSHQVQSWCDESEFSLERIRPSVLHAPTPPALRVVPSSSCVPPEVWDRLAA